MAEKEWTIYGSTATRCHCGARFNGSDHCPRCYCEQFEADCGRRPTVANAVNGALRTERRRLRLDSLGREAEKAGRALRKAVRAESGLRTEHALKRISELRDEVDRELEEALAAQARAEAREDQQRSDDEQKLDVEAGER